MKLEEYFRETDASQRELMLGIEGAEPLTHGFREKRAVHAGIGGGMPVPAEEAQRVWHEAMSEAPPRGAIRRAYIHIPFCSTKCLYCGFFQNGTNKTVEDRYMDLLIAEMERESHSRRLQEGRIHAVFIGGGTPTSLSAKNSERLLKAIHEYLPLANDCELTLEGRVNDLVPEKMDVWMACGVNRMSIGVQSFYTKIRQQVGRIDDGETVLRRLEELKNYGDCTVIIDLMYGLPDQTLEIWRGEMEILEQAPIDGMDLYQLNVWPDSDLSKRIKSGKLPSTATLPEQAEMFALARDFLTKRAFERLSSAHWRKSPRERSLYNNLGKTGHELIPFGSGAGGSVAGYSTMLHRALQPYEAMVSAGDKPLMFLMKSPDIQPIVNILVGQLDQCYYDPRQLEAIDERLTELRWLFDYWSERGLAEFNGVMYRLTPAGEFWYMTISQTAAECVQLLLTGSVNVLESMQSAREAKIIRNKTAGAQPARMPNGHPAGISQSGKMPDFAKKMPDNKAKKPTGTKP